MGSEGVLGGDGSVDVHKDFKAIRESFYNLQRMNDTLFMSASHYFSCIGIGLWEPLCGRLAQYSGLRTEESAGSLRRHHVA